MGWLKGEDFSFQFCCSFTYPVAVKWLAKTVWPFIICCVGLAPLIPFNLQNNKADPSVLLEMLSVSSVPTEWQGLTLVTNDFLCVCSPEVIGKNPSFEALNSNKSAVVITKHGHFTMVLLAGLVAMLVALQCPVAWKSPGCDKWRPFLYNRSVYPCRAGGALGRVALLQRRGVTFHLINLIVRCCSNGWYCSFGFHLHPKPRVFGSFPLCIVRSWVMVYRKCCLY